jgi:hypothetical protein
MPSSPDPAAITGTDWMRAEVEATVTAYFRMLDLELRGIPFNKAEQNRQLQQLLPGRSGGSIEFKHANISAVLTELGYPSIDGYKRRSNYQDLLREVVEDRLSVEQSLEDLVRQSVTKPIDEVVSTPGDLLSMLVPVPKPDPDERKSVVRETSRRAVFTPRNYLEMEARNRSLGRAGEELVMQFEHQRLWTAGERSLADRIEHVAASGQDHLGYDILSFDTDGRERFIEVKTTRFGSLTPFFASRNEVTVSESSENFYYLYRLFKFADAPKLFTLQGSLRRTCQLEPTIYSAVPS